MDDFLRDPSRWNTANSLSVTIMSLWANHSAALIPHTVTRREDLRGGEEGGDKDGEEVRDNRKGMREGGGKDAQERGERRGGAGESGGGWREGKGWGEVLFDERKQQPALGLSRK